MTRADIYKLIDSIYRQMNQNWHPDKPKEIFSLICKWRRGNHFPQDIKATVSNGCLYLNGEFVERIAYYADYIPRYGIHDGSGKAEYYEEMILARQELD